MIFSSIPFFIFFAVYFPLHLITPRQFRIYLILFGSLIFYGYYLWNYLWIPILLTVIAYLGALAVEKEQHPQRRKLRLSGTITLLLLPLIFYKYTDFFATQVIGPLFGWQQKLVNLPLPLGISFFTFTLIAYVVDVYKGRFPLERQFKMLLAYVLYFPHQIAGPILKPIKLIPQLERPKAASHARFTFGAFLFAIGLAKKIIFADSIAPLVDTAYQAAVSTLPLPSSLIAFYGFPMQIYCDFSGYTDMALGLAFLLGVRLPTNFARPYMADSLVDFWQRWHITFSFYLRDYLYIPLGGNRHGLSKQIRNVFITMLLGGLWHGARWTFVAWGGLHAIGISLTHLWRHFNWGRHFPRIPRWLAVFVTFHVICVTWVFFRAPNFSTAGMILKSLIIGIGNSPPVLVSGYSFAVALLIFFYATHRFDDLRRWFVFTRRTPAGVVWGAIAGLIILTIALGGANSAAFIYFDF